MAESRAGAIIAARNPGIAMTTCRCCGQNLPSRATALRRAQSPSSATSAQQQSHADAPQGPSRSRATPSNLDEPLRADDTLVMCWRDAQALAASQHAEAVEIAHLVLSIAEAEELRGLLNGMGLPPHDLARVARDLLADEPRRPPSRGSASDPGPSTELGCVLQAAEQRARLREGYAIGAQDVLRTLIDDGHNFASAGFFSALCQSLSRPRGVLPPMTMRDDRLVEADDTSRQHGPARERERDHELDHEQDRVTRQLGLVVDELRSRLAAQDQIIAKLADRLQGRAYEHGASSTRHAASAAHGGAPGDADRSREAVPMSSASASATANATDVLAGLVARLEARVETALRQARRNRRRPRPLRARSAEMGRGAESWRRRHISDTSAVAAAPALVHLQRNDGPADLEDELTDDAAFEPEDDADEPIAEALGLSKRFYLSIDDDIVHAPSIGPRTAGRLRPLGIRRVRDLLGCPPGKLYEMLASRHISKLRIEAWQHQARLVCTVPWLRGTHAQLLVGAGYVSAAAIVAADRAAVCAAVLRFAVTREGQSILRSGAAPDIEKIMRWTDHARLAELTRAA